MFPFESRTTQSVVLTRASENTRIYGKNVRRSNTTPDCFALKKKKIFFIANNTHDRVLRASKTLRVPLSVPSARIRARVRKKATSETPVRVRVANREYIRLCATTESSRVPRNNLHDVKPLFIVRRVIYATTRVSYVFEVRPLRFRMIGFARSDNSSADVPPL